MLEFLHNIDWNNVLQQFVYDRKNPLLFNSGFFVYFFTLFLALFYFLRNHSAIKRYVFCFFSLYFFYKASGWFVGIVILSAIVNYLISNGIYKNNKKYSRVSYLTISIIFNLGVLFFFKYTNFFLHLSNEFLKTGFNPLNIILPIGISFFTFENLSYTVDVYRGDFKPAEKFTDYLLFLSFFPKLMMGPIVRAHDFVPQINKPYFITEQDFAKGFFLIISGLIKKLIISDYITLNFVNYIFEDPSLHTGIENLFAVYGYALVIYCDFSGYSDIAIGIAQWLGFKIPPNFLSPYQSKSITEFWRRWHISLSTWLKDYLYIPLGGNRNFSYTSLGFVTLFLLGTFFCCHNVFGLPYIFSIIITAILLIIMLLQGILKRSINGISSSFNLVTTMLLGGFWHGASWNFIIWGAIHGIGLSIHKIWMLLTGKYSDKFNQSKLYKILMALITFHFVCFGWVFFKADSLNVAKTMLEQIFTDFRIDVFIPFFNNYKNVLGIMLIALLLHLIPDNFIDKVIAKYNKIPLYVYVIIFFLFLILYGYFKTSQQVMPIYLQF